MTANAGADRSVTTGTMVELDGSASSSTLGGSLSYRWSLAAVPAASSAALAARTSVKPVFWADLSGSYIATLTVSDGAVASPAATVRITASPRPAVARAPPAADSTLVSGCREIATSGDYALAADLQQPSGTDWGACIYIHDTSGVVLDCAGHTITGGDANVSQGLDVLRVSDLTIRNCTLIDVKADLSVITRGIVTANTLTSTPGSRFGSLFSAWGSSQLEISDNTVQGAIQSMYGDAVSIVGNRITAGPTPELVNCGRGASTRILRNSINGRWNANRGMAFPFDGGDDGILLQDETGATVQFNVIQNVYDSGVEWTGTLRSATISGNLIGNAGFAGLGAWYWASLVDSRIEQNYVVTSGSLFQFYRNYGLRPARWDDAQLLPADPGVLFQNNHFEGNVTRALVGYYGELPTTAATLPIYDDLDYAGEVSNIVGERPATTADFQLSNNVFTGNDFDHTTAAPFFGVKTAKPGMIIDGGGNACIAPTASDYPLRCH